MNALFKPVNTLSWSDQNIKCELKIAQLTFLWWHILYITCDIYMVMISVFGELGSDIFSAIDLLIIVTWPQFSRQSLVF
jgi:hypothetical protein